MAKEIPILFSTPMVQAILDGRKTMTRRVVKMDDLLENPDRFKSAGDSREWDVPRPAIKYDDRIWFAWELRNSNARTWIERCRYKPGDILWVRESYGIYDRPDTPVYKAGNDGWNDQARKEVKFKPSIHMPKDACRIWLEVTNVRVERLKDITEQDATAEGIEPVPSFDSGNGVSGTQMFKNYTREGYNELLPKDSFTSLWISINGTESWLVNPWVWVVEYTGFERAYLYRLMSERRIPYSKPTGKSAFFSKEELDKWLLSNPVEQRS